ncbi:hypothetical protein Desde_1111 [Desulfitobacterium dehalogenans ATCC 51507]|uniref:DUF4878 domain-containing protein n=1 Tax=Desulfitobacterium dehalogenans (strain ATCC 51507 / DSM 9161 / JW/IU-DC1) TaxID=756499 RepID=I4A6F9_DESDJ|nr:hypothetical protein [Desulfitobacterium dehalogenans]AFL99543.1 hypothetical protein Desde_1111 [Desulfitobacterium dehalogenans ATCC 51507]
MRIKRVLVVMSILSLMAISGCTGTANAAGGAKNIDDPEKVAQEFLEAFRACDFTTVGELTGRDIGPVDMDDLGYAPHFLSKMTFRLSDPMIKGDEAIVPVRITKVDEDRLYKTIMTEGYLLQISLENAGEFNQEDFDKRMDALIHQELEKSNLAMITLEAEINLQKQEGNWVIIIDEALVNVLIGSPDW